jgi:hypothetical protein
MKTKNKAGEHINEINKNCSHDTDEQASRLVEISGSHGSDMKVAVIWVVAPCSVVETDRRFRGSYCLYHQGPDGE